MSARYGAVSFLSYLKGNEHFIQGQIALVLNPEMNLIPVLSF